MESAGVLGSASGVGHKLDVNQAPSDEHEDHKEHEPNESHAQPVLPGGRVGNPALAVLLVFHGTVSS
jgi:hypothetical protein